MNQQVKVILKDHREVFGQLLGFDSHSNLILKDSEEFRKLKRRKKGETREVKRNLGLVIFRGENVVRVDIVGPAGSSGNRLNSKPLSSILQNSA